MIDQVVNEVDNNVEVIKDDEVNQDIISIDQLVNQTSQQQVSNQQTTIPNQVVQTPVVNQSTPKKKDKVLTIQITLIIIWAILTALVYFFGYDLFEPFIKV